MKSDVKLIETILDGIYYEITDELRANEKGFNQADIFVDLYFKENFAEIIFNSLKNDTDLAKIAALLDILVWSTPDNGTKLEKLIYDWIISDNKIKVQIILLRQDSFPRSERVENIKVLENVKQIFPELTELCNYHIDEFDYQKKNRSKTTRIASPHS
ncbi:MAG TPA: hypothetical protein VF465_10935 [Flavobacterium sp.]|uniref:hypothetical protein n=1 Tax=Flavobacterium sp. TaxID=239 RepID=UPI002ED2F339